MKIKRILLLGFVAAGLLAIGFMSMSNVGIVEVSATQWTGLNYPRGVAIGDYDNDGLNDLAFTEALRSWVYKSDGTIDLFGVEASSVAIGDYDNDGLNDIAFSEGPQVTVYRSDGTTIIKQWTGLDTSTGVAIGDYDNDGLNDLAFTERGYGIIAGEGFTVLPTSVAAGIEFVLPITGWDLASVEFANPGSSSASVTVRIYSSDGMLKGTWSSAVPARGCRSTLDFISNIYSYANPAVVEITSDQPLLAMNRRWTDDPMAGAGFTVLPTSVAAGMEFVLPITGWEFASVEFANPRDSSASVTVKIYDSGGSHRGTWSSTVPPKGCKSTWDFLAGSNIYLYANPAVVEITSDQPLLAMNRRWRSSMAGAGFTVLPTSVAAGMEFVLPITGWDFASVELANPEDVTASVTVRIYDSSGTLMNTWSYSVPPKGCRSTWDFISNIYAYANPAFVKITSDQPLLAMNRRWTISNRVIVYKSDGTTIIKQWTGLAQPIHVAIGDYDNDGLNDIAFTEYMGGRVTVYKSDGTTIIKQWTGLNNPWGVAIGDYDNDGLNDLAFTEFGAGRVWVYKSDGTTIIKQWTGLGNYGVAIGDYNNNHLNDLAFTEDGGSPVDGKVTVYYQTKPGTVARVAEPTIVTLRGTLTNATGYPILSGSIRVTVKDSFGTQVWQDTFNNIIDNGKYNIPLGAKTTLMLIKGQIYSAILEVDADSLTFVSADVTYGDNNPTGDIIKFVA